MKKKIIVFGRGAYWQRKKIAIKDKYDVVAFIDNNACSESEDKVPVYLPDKVHDLPKCNIVVMSTQKYFFEMILQLKGLGVPTERIILGMQIAPCFNEGEEVLHSLHGEFEIGDTDVVLKCDVGSFPFADIKGFHEVMRKLMQKRDFFKGDFSAFPLVPLSRNFGTERGKAIDRYYIEMFLRENRRYITGAVLEVADTSYIRIFGHDVDKMVSLHVANWGGTGQHIQGNLETGEGIPENMFDCMICTQTIQMIYDVHATVRNIYRLLKPGGVALVTASGISQISRNDYDNWGEYWRFTKKSMRRLMEEVFPKENIQVGTWGNVKTSLGFLYGLCQEDFTEADCAYNDEQYPLIVTAKCVKPCKC